MSIDFEMSPDLVMAPSTDLGDHWSKVARERIRSKGNDIRSRGFFTGIPMNLISNEAKSHIRYSGTSAYTVCIPLCGHH